MRMMNLASLVMRRATVVIILLTMSEETCKKPTLLDLRVGIDAAHLLAHGSRDK